MDQDQEPGSGAVTAVRASLWAVLAQVLYLGAIGYGGPTTLDYLKRIFVERNGWFSEQEFGEALGLAQVLPGSTGVSAVSYFGYRRFGHLGALLFPLVFLTPSIAALLALSWAYVTFGNLSFVPPLFVGLGALVVALLLNATLSLGRAVCTGGTGRVVRGLTVAAVTFVGSAAFGFDAVWLVAGSGVLGIALFGVRVGEPAPGTLGRPVSREPRAGLATRLTPWLVLMILVGAALVDPTTRTLFAAFFQIGLLAFGGGFASVALLQHVVVEQFHWLSFTQFRDGLALGQITPGPVLITATFVGFKVGGLAGSLAATLGIFLPPALLVALLADLHERVKKLRPVRALVTGFQCGVIGLVAAITIKFALNSLVNWQTWVVFGLSFGYVWGLRRSPGWAILATAAFSLVFLRG